LDFRAATPPIRRAIIIILMDIIGIRTFTTIPMPGIHMHIIPLPQAIGTVGIGLITATIDIIITTTIEPMSQRTVAIIA
jgi:hypothetical protein